MPPKLPLRLLGVSTEPESMPHSPPAIVRRTHHARRLIARRCPVHPLGGVSPFFDGKATWTKVSPLVLKPTRKRRRHEGAGVHRVADQLRSAAGRRRHAGSGYLSPAGASAMPRYMRERKTTAPLHFGVGGVEATAGRECHAQKAGRRSDAGQAHSSGSHPKKV